jgi:hypothetical protein
MQNGDGPHLLDQDAIDAHVYALQQAAEAAQRLAAVKRNEYDAALDQAKRLQRAVDALQPADAKAKPRIGSWQVSNAKVAEVLAAIRAIDADEFTASDIHKAMGKGTSWEAVRKSCDVLREREVLRLVRGTRGGGKVLALMPDHK